ncbi:MAG TPA: DUF6801 domain-containing protein [Nocardioidaceae bacterium]|nr:DUF6801 domain-containing protein [Nocardioidaceae bacterium]
MTLSGSPASAVTYQLTTTYLCDAPVLGDDQPFTGTLTFDAPSSVPAGSTVTARPIGISVTIPDATVQKARDAGVTAISATSSNVTYRVGSKTVPVTGVSIPKTDIPETGDMVIATQATAGQFVAGVAGQYPVKVPQSFTLAAKAYSIITLDVTVSCTLAPEAADLLGTLTVTKVASTTAVKLLNPPITTSKQAKVRVIVRAAGLVPTGKVVAKLGTKILKSGTLSGGKVQLLLPKLTAGDKKVKFIYKGNPSVKPSSKVLLIRVTRG